MTGLVERGLAVRGLSVRFRQPGADVAAVSEVDLDLEPGRCLALVGESGCGKSVLVSALLGLLPANAEVRGSAVLHDDTATLELLTAPERVLSTQVRGRRIGVVPQSPTSSLTPVRTVRSQLQEVLRARHGRGEGTRAARRAAQRERADAAAARAGLPARALDHYPHELSGGMAQRAVTALALAGEAWLLLADEPTTGLDRALVDHTLAELRHRVAEGDAVLLVTHDLDAAARVADTVAVVYAGRVVEHGPIAEVLAHPRHPYTRGLRDALPRNGFHPIPGTPPELTALPTGCAFSARCDRADAACSTRPPLLDAAGATVDPTGRHRSAACHHPC